MDQRFCAKTVGAITSGFGRVAGNGLKVLEGLLSDTLHICEPGKEPVGVTFQSARSLVQHFVTRTCLSILRDGGGTGYQYTPCVRLFSDPT